MNTSFKVGQKLNLEISEVNFNHVSVGKDEKEEERRRREERNSIGGGRISQNRTPKRVYGEKSGVALPSKVGEGWEAKKQGM